MSDLSRKMSAVETLRVPTIYSPGACRRLEQAIMHARRNGLAIDERDIKAMQPRLRAFFDDASRLDLESTVGYKMVRVAQPAEPQLSLLQGANRLPNVVLTRAREHRGVSAMAHAGTASGRSPDRPGRPADDDRPRVARFFSRLCSWGRER